MLDSLRSSRRWLIRYGSTDLDQTGRSFLPPSRQSRAVDVRRRIGDADPPKECPSAWLYRRLKDGTILICELSLQSWMRETDDEVLATRSDCSERVLARTGDRQESDGPTATVTRTALVLTGLGASAGWYEIVHVPPPTRTPTTPPGAPPGANARTAGRGHLAAGGPRMRSWRYGRATCRQVRPFVDSASLIPGLVGPTASIQSAPPA